MTALDTQPPDAILEQLEAALPHCMGSDRGEFARRLQGLRRRLRQDKPIDRSLPRLTEEIVASREQAARRRTALPTPAFPAELPVVQKREEIARAIRDHQVVVVCGETGSGKTTQLPKLCLELGLGSCGTIGHTQPRRIAARSVAARISEELGVELGGPVGYKVRFSDRVSKDTVVKLMTDGMLLAESQQDRDLAQYEVIIIDEAHERSLNIDFLLGYLHRLLPRRPDLKLIITSATIDPARFAHHFGDAPIIEVSGRTYPVEIRYRPLATDDEDERDRDMQQAILDAVDEISSIDRGDILIFLAGERDIRETAESLRKHHPPHTEVIPLYARLSASEQNRVFQPHGGRRIVLATNVAETSLTVPGIRYVIDPGLARISRYSPRAKIQRLPIERISQASADQRAGRCGRVAAGVCIRLYDEEDFQSRPAFTDPEILRTNLASVILQMAYLKLGEVEDFPFVEPPDTRLVTDGYKLLFELGAVDDDRRITELGRQLARLPIDPKLARMILAGEREGALRETLIITSALAIQDPRERPLEHQQAADEKHRRFRDEHSDFSALLNLWNYYHEQARHLSQAKLRGLCRGEFLSFVRMREWHDLYVQLHTQVGEMGLRENQQEAAADALHRALLTGLLGNIGLKQDSEQHYLGARGRKFHVFPGSGLFKKSPKWLMAAELVETTRLYSRTCARVQPQWIEPLAGHLVKRSYTAPHWEKRPAQVGALENVTLYGLPIVVERRINYGPIDPVRSREIFILHALVRQEFQCRAPFFRHNREMIREVEELEAKARRRDVLVDEDSLYRFYDERVPAGIYSGPHFERWRKQAERDDSKLLFLRREDLMAHEASEITGEKYPDHLLINGIRLPLGYRFEPGAPDDGVTLTVPLAALNQLDPERLEWLIPGLLAERMAALLKSLPKSLRRNFVPVPNFVTALLQRFGPDEGALLPAMSRHLQRITGVEVPEDAWNPDAIPPHLRLNIRVVDEADKVLAEDRDLAAIRRQLRGEARRSFAALPTPEFERDEVRDWDFGELPEVVSFTRNNITLQGYPALVDAGERVQLKLMDSPARAGQEHRRGLRRLISSRQRDKIRYLKRNLPDIQKMALHYLSVGTQKELQEDLHTAIVDRAYLGDAPLPRSLEEFEARLQAGNGALVSVANETGTLVAEALAEYHAVKKRLGGNIPLSWFEAVADINDQLQHLVYPGFISHTSQQWLQHLPRYLKAINSRLRKLEHAPDKDRQRRGDVARLWEACKARMAAHREAERVDPALVQLRWMIEELRVSLFAQELKTAMPVSVKRVEEQLDRVKR